MGSFIGPSIAITGVALSGAAAIVTQAMNSRLSSVQDGSFVREMIQHNRMPDVFAPFIVDRGAVGRGWGMRNVACTAANQSRYRCTIGGSVQRPHGGQDIGGSIGVGVHALRTGLVEQSGQINGYGEMLLLRHPDGSTSLYAHLNDRLFDKGMLVQGGSLIGRLGNTSGLGSKPPPAAQGSASDPRCQHFRGMGPHTHFGVHGTGNAKLPSNMILGRAINTDSEWRFGTNPATYLGSHGVSFVGTQSGGAAPESMEGLHWYKETI